MGRGAQRRPLGDLDRPLRVPLGRAEDARPRRLLEDPERRPGDREPAADDPPLRRPRGPDHAQPDGRAARDEPGEAVRPLPAQGHARGRLRRRHRHLRPGEARDDLGRDPPLEGRLQPATRAPRSTGRPRSSSCAATSSSRAASSSPRPGSGSTSRGRGSARSSPAPGGGRAMKMSFAADEARRIGEQIGSTRPRLPSTVEPFRIRVVVELEPTLHCARLGGWHCEASFSDSGDRVQALPLASRARSAVQIVVFHAPKAAVDGLRVGRDLREAADRPPERHGPRGRPRLHLGRLPAAHGAVRHRGSRARPTSATRGRTLEGAAGRVLHDGRQPRRLVRLARVGPRPALVPRRPGDPHVLAAEPVSVDG